MQSDMNFLRSSPFIPFDCVLQAPILVSHVFIRSCCAFSASAGVATAAKAPIMAKARSRFIGTLGSLIAGVVEISVEAGCPERAAVDPNSVYGNRNGRSNELADSGPLHVA